MNKQAADLLEQVSLIETQLSQCEAILSKADRHPNGLTMEEAKTMVWRAAKVKHGRLFIELRKANQQLNKLRKLSHFDIVDGKRISVYKYKS